MKAEMFWELSDLEEEALKRMARVPRYCNRLTISSIRLPSIGCSANTKLPPIFEYSDSNGSTSFRFRGGAEFAEQINSEKNESAKDCFEEYLLLRKEFAEKIELVQKLIGCRSK